MSKKSKIEGLMTYMAEPPPEQAELQRLANDLGFAVVGYDMYGKEIGRAEPIKPLER